MLLRRSVVKRNRLSLYVGSCVWQTLTMNVDEEVQKLKEEITRLGEKLSDGSVTVR